MSVFDPFGDYKEKGYLQNRYALPVGKKLKMLEHNDFVLYLPDALTYLSMQSSPDYDDLLEVHKTLFEALYPWAGKDRDDLLPFKTVFKGSTVFADSHNLRKAFDVAMKADSFGKVLGHLAYTHPFLDGNGRTIFTFFEDYLRRNNVLLEWTALDKNSFLTSLDQQIARPDHDVMDRFLEPHLKEIKSTKEKVPSKLLGIQWNKK